MAHEKLPRDASQIRFNYAEHPGRTKQADQKGTDLKSIVDKWRRTGEHPPLSRSPKDAVYADFSNVDDYLQAIQKVHRAAEAFENLPARIRDHFENDPADLVDAWHDPTRRSELEHLGMIEPTGEAISASEQSDSSEPTADSTPVSTPVPTPVPTVDPAPDQ